MILEVYAGKRQIIRLVQYYKMIQFTKNSWMSEAKVGYVAIPGGAVHNEKTVREWAREYGYHIKKVFEAGIDHETAVPVS